MARMSVEAMRKIVSDSYAGPAWKKKVASMPANQVIRIYLDMQKRRGHNGTI